MQTRRSVPVGYIPAGLVCLQPRPRRLRSPGAPSSRRRKVRNALLIIGSLITTSYLGWLTHLASTNGLHVAGAKPAPVTKSAAPAVLPIPAPSSVGDKDLLARAQLENELLYTDLQSFVCNEHIQRFKGKLKDETGKQIDTVSARVSFEDGAEQYSDIRQNDHPRAGLSRLSGAWSQGEFATLLRQTRALLGTQSIAARRDADLNGTAAAVYTIDVSEQDSPWELVVDGTRYKIPFRTEVWVAKTSGQIRKIDRLASNLPPALGISELHWGVGLDSVDLNGKSWLLPTSGEYEVQYAHLNKREWNVMTFSDYQRYGSRVVLHF